MEERLERHAWNYKTVRAQDDRSALADGHEAPEPERVVARTDPYSIVDKIDAAELFVDDDLSGSPSV